MKDYIFEVGINIYRYMTDSKHKTKLHTVSANTEEEAKQKILSHYKNISDEYAVSYVIDYIEVIEHIY